MKQRTFFATAVLALVASCQGCFGCPSPVEDPNLVLVRSCESAPPLIEPPRLDILFVIDNSNSMREEQEAVARELTAFIDEIKNSGGVPTEFNVGVITTSIYLNGRVGGQPFVLNYPRQSGKLRPVPVELADGGIDLEPADAQRLLSGTDPELIPKFARLIRQGTQGSGQETPFEAVRLALLSDLATTPIANGGNQEFLRDGARLLVVLLTDEDDCSETARPPTVSVGDNGAVADCTTNEMSLTTVSEYHRMFTEDLKNGDGTVKEVIWTAIAPVGVGTKAALAVVDNNQVRNIDCPTSNQGGFRQRQMAEMFDSTLINLDSICRTSFRETLINIAQLASVAQTIEIKNVPDERLMQFVITRKTGEVQNCTLSNEGIVNFSRSTEGTTAKVQFGNQCRRRADDQAIIIKMICAT
ncbi:MAG: VWA domain-containing protein [Archangium sp.]|nr:VWA domain-containing protein [Archangium sp.]MDP3152912.1 VWA domain-containing protein [Archangium sp.]MDP3569930.1 VWA domain-containing protein [Archangium sp.]